MSRIQLQKTIAPPSASNLLYSNLCYGRSVLHEAQIHNYRATVIGQRSSPFLPSAMKSRSTRLLRVEYHGPPPTLCSSPIFDAELDPECQYFGGELTSVNQLSPSDFSGSSMGLDDPVLRVSQRIDDSEAASPSPSTSNSLPGIHEEDVDIVPHSLRYKDAFSTLPTVQAMTGRPTISSDDNSVPRSGFVLLSPSNTECCIVGKHIFSQADLGTTQTLNDTVNIMRDGHRREEDSNNDSVEAVINGASPAVVNSSIAISKVHFTDKHMLMSMLSIGTRDGMDDTSEGNGFDAHDNLEQSSPLVASTSHHACAVSSPGNANARVTLCLASTSPTLIAHDAGTCSSPDTMMDDDDLANGQDTPQHATSSVSGPVQPAPALPTRGNTGNQITTEAELRPSDTVFACLFEDCRFEGTSQQVLQHCIDDHSYASGACPISTCTSTFSATREWKRHVESVHWRLRDNFIECRRCGVWLRRDDKRHIRSCRAVEGSKRSGNEDSAEGPVL